MKLSADLSSKKKLVVKQKGVLLIVGIYGR